MFPGLARRLYASMISPTRLAMLSKADEIALVSGHGPGGNFPPKRRQG